MCWWIGSRERLRPRRTSERSRSRSSGIDSINPRAFTTFAWWLLLPELLHNEHRYWLNEILKRVPELQKATASVRYGGPSLRGRQERAVPFACTKESHMLFGIVA